MAKSKLIGRLSLRLSQADLATLDGLVSELRRARPGGPWARPNRSSVLRELLEALMGRARSSGGSRTRPVPSMPARGGPGR